MSRMISNYPWSATNDQRTGKKTWGRLCVTREGFERQSFVVKNEIQVQGGETNRLKQQVKVAMEISAEEKQVSEDAIKALEEKLNMANNMLEQRKSELSSWKADKQHKQRLVVDGGHRRSAKNLSMWKRA